MKLKYNLQFFAEEEEEEVETPEEEESVDTNAFAELIADRDKKIESLEKEMKLLRKSNADLLVKISSHDTPKKTFEENLLDLVGDTPRKE